MTPEIPEIPDIITFELLKVQRRPLRFLLERVSHVTFEGLLQKIFSLGMVSLIREALSREKECHQPAGASEFVARGEPISPHPFRRIPSQMTVNLTRLQQLALSDLLQHERLRDPHALMDQVINAGLHAMYDAETGADLDLSVEEQIEVARKAKRPPVAPAFASAPVRLATTAARRRKERMGKLLALLRDS
jgi:hypothetical protein